MLVGGVILAARHGKRTWTRCRHLSYHFHRPLLERYAVARACAAMRVELRNALYVFSVEGRKNSIRHCVVD